jgi:hypothetical protein
MGETTKSIIAPVTQGSELPIDSTPMSVPKPVKSSLDKFKSTARPTIADVGTLLTALPHHKISDTGDYSMLHPNEAEFWSPEFCFVSVPIVGQKNDLLHLIAEHLAQQYLPSKRVQRFRLALATKPHDVFYLCHVPTQNLDNSWNKTNLEACLEAKLHWIQADSRKAEGAEGYQINYARSDKAFPEPSWPKQTLDELINVTFKGRMIESDDHPGLLRLIGAPQVLT